jgi:hypothetical protein
MNFFQRLRHWCLNLARSVAGWIWIVSVAGALVELLSEAVYWLKTATWPGWTAADALKLAELNQPETSWLGAKKLLQFCLATPLSVSVLLAGAILGNIVWRFSLFLIGGRNAAR